SLAENQSLIALPDDERNPAVLGSRKCSKPTSPNILTEGGSSGDSPVNTCTTLFLSGGEQSGTEGSSASLSQVQQKQVKPTNYYHLYAKPQSLLMCSRFCLQDRLQDEEVITYAWKRIPPDGGILSIEETDVSVIIPPKAFGTQVVRVVYLSVRHSVNDRPSLKENQTLLSPTIEFGPFDLTPLESLTLKFRHCAALSSGNWLIQLMGQSLPNLYSADKECGKRTREPMSVQENSSLRDKSSSSTPGPWQVSSFSEDFVMMFPSRERQTFGVPSAHAGRIFMSLPSTTCEASVAKLLRFAAFTAPCDTTRDNSIRIYVLPDTNDTLKIVTRIEMKLGGKLVDLSRQFPFSDDGGCLIFQIVALSDGFRSRLPGGK
ncbi:ZU5 domain protein, partial [Opisthorchis viverrini]